MEKDEIYVEQERITEGINNFEILKCIICLNVSNSASLLECCENVICKKCTDSWLMIKNVCPMCKFDNPSIHILNKFISRLFSTLKVSCEFVKEGCTEKKLSFESVIKHQTKCEFNPKAKITCQKCETEYEKSQPHDCIQVLKFRNKLIHENYFELKRAVQNCLNSYIYHNVSVDTFVSSIAEALAINSEDNLDSANLNSLTSRRNQDLFYSDPTKLKYKADVGTGTQSQFTIDNLFSVFESFNGEFILAYCKSTLSMEIVDLKTMVTKKSINDHTDNIFVVRHFPEYWSKRDYIITTSKDLNLIVYSSYMNYNAVVKISTNHNSNFLYSATMLLDEANKKTYVISSVPNDVCKVWNVGGDFIRSLGSSSDYTYHLNYWHNAETNNFYLMNSNSRSIKFYDFETNEVWREFKGDQTNWHMSAYVYYIRNMPKLFETDGGGRLRMWDINSAKLEKVVHAENVNLRGLCVWNEKYILASSSNKTIIIFNLYSMQKVMELKGHTNIVCSLAKLRHPSYGEAMFSTSVDGKIKLFTLN